MSPLEARYSVPPCQKRIAPCSTPPKARLSWLCRAYVKRRKQAPKSSTPSTELRRRIEARSELDLVEAFAGSTVVGGKRAVGCEDRVPHMPEALPLIVVAQRAVFLPGFQPQPALAAPRRDDARPLDEDRAGPMPGGGEPVDIESAAAVVAPYQRLIALDEGHGSLHPVLRPGDIDFSAGNRGGDRDGIEWLPDGK